MGGNADEVKGRLKEAAGVVTNDKDLENEGKVDRAAGQVKRAVEAGKDKVEDMVEDAKDKIQGH